MVMLWDDGQISAQIGMKSLLLGYVALCKSLPTWRGRRLAQLNGFIPQLSTKRYN